MRTFGVVGKAVQLHGFAGVALTVLRERHQGDLLQRVGKALQQPVYHSCGTYCGSISSAPVEGDALGGDGDGQALAVDGGLQDFALLQRKCVALEHVCLHLM